MADLWRDDLVDFALDQDMLRQVEEQKQWIAREPDNARPYYQLGLLYRMRYKAEPALGLLLESVRLDGTFAPAHHALAEMYAVQGDYRASWRHARVAEGLGDARGVEMLRRHGVDEPTSSSA